jgi:hypothetical protein
LLALLVLLALSTVLAVVFVKVRDSFAVSDECMPPPIVTIDSDTDDLLGMMLFDAQSRADEANAVVVDSRVGLVFLMVENEVAYPVGVAGVIVESEPGRFAALRICTPSDD